MCLLSTSDDRRGTSPLINGRKESLLIGQSCTLVLGPSFEIHWTPSLPQPYPTLSSNRSPEHHHNCLLKVLKKKAGGKGSKKGARQADKSETKVEQLPSFFHFFSPPTLPEGMTVAPDSLAAAIQEDYELGYCTFP